MTQDAQAGIALVALLAIGGAAFLALNTPGGKGTRSVPPGTDPLSADIRGCGCTGPSVLGG